MIRKETRLTRFPGPAAWNFYFDDETSVTSQHAPDVQGDTAHSVEADTEEEVPVDAEIKENVRLLSRRFRSSTSHSLLSIPVTETASAPASLPSSTNPSPTRPPPPSHASLASSSTSEASIRIQTPPRTTDHVPHSPTYPTSYPSLNIDAEEESGGFSEGGIGLFENLSDERSLNGLGFRVDIEAGDRSVDGSRRGKKRMSEENGDLRAETDRILEKKPKTGP